MLNKKGFTLLEIIIVIAIIAAASLVIGVNFVGLSEQQKVNEYANMVKQATYSARTYVNITPSVKNTLKSSGSIDITVDILIQNGYIETGLMDPRDETVLFDGTIRVIYTSTSGDITYYFYKGSQLIYDQYNDQYNID